MRSINKTFTSSKCVVINGKTGDILATFFKEGSTSEKSVLMTYISKFGYQSDLEVIIMEQYETYSITADNFKRYGVKINPKRSY